MSEHRYGNRRTRTPLASRTTRGLHLSLGQLESGQRWRVPTAAFAQAERRGDTAVGLV